ncbi:MAG: cation:proton antiporter [Candidatus Altiarchaeota archaeon]
MEITIFSIGAFILAFLMILCFFRVIFGPTIPDKVVSLDTINTLVVSTMMLLGAAYKEAIYIDIAIVYALLSFVTTLFIAKYIEEKSERK